MATIHSNQQTDLLAVCYKNEWQLGNLFYARHEAGLHCEQCGQREQGKRQSWRVKSRFDFSFYLQNVQVLSDSMEFVPLPLSGQGSDDVIHGDISSQNLNSNQHSGSVKEILMVGLGNRGSRPTLFIRTETDILIYRVSQNALRSIIGRDKKAEFYFLDFD